MLLGRVSYENQDLYLNSQQIIGINGINISYNQEISPVNILGKGFIGYDSNQQSIELQFDMFASNNELDIIKNIDGQFTGIFLYRNNISEEYKRIVINNLKLKNYQIQCGVGSLASCSFTMEGMRDIHSSGNLISLNTGNFSSLKVARPGDVSISNYDDFTNNNALQSFSYSVAIPITKNYSLGSGINADAITNSPIAVNVEFQFNLQDAKSGILSSVFCEDSMTAAFNLKNCEDSIRNFYISGAKLNSISIDGQVGSNATISVSYSTFVNSFEDLKKFTTGVI